MIRSTPDSADLVQRYAGLVDDPSAFEAAVHAEPSRFFWVHPLRSSPQAVCSVLEGDGFVTEALAWHPGAFRVRGDGRGLGRHWAYLGGLFHIQEAASMTPARLLDPSPGHRVLDLCAAPGNKTAQLALALGNGGTVVANDFNAERLRPLARIVSRLGLFNVSATHRDGTTFGPAAEGFDRILVDAPCSGEGTVRRHPHLLHRAGLGAPSLESHQRGLLRRAVSLCRTGGRIVYSTCTFAPEENERVVNAVLEAFAGRVRLLSAHGTGMRTAPGLTRWKGEAYRAELENTARIWPHLQDTDGFYLALLEKTDDTPRPERPGERAGRSRGRGARFEPLDPAADKAVKALLGRRFGVPETALDGMRLLTKGSKHVHAADGNHRPPPGPLVALGLPLMHLHLRYPKLTTAGAMALGHRARRNVVDVDRSQADDYLHRRAIVLSDSQRGRCSGGDGYVLLRHGGFVLGVGLLIEGRSEVLSYYPKAFAL